MEGHLFFKLRVLEQNKSIRLHVNERLNYETGRLTKCQRSSRKKKTYGLTLEMVYFGGGFFWFAWCLRQIIANQDIIDGKMRIKFQHHCRFSGGEMSIKFI